MQVVRTKHVWPVGCKNHQRFMVTMCTRNNLREIKFVVTVGTSADDEAHKVELIYSLGDGVSCSCSCYCCCCCCCCCCCHTCSYLNNNNNNNNTLLYEGDTDKVTTLPACLIKNNIFN